MNAALAVDLAVNGLITGLFYALMAIGLSLIFGILRVVNFAHGEFYMVGAYAYSMIALAAGVPVWLALPFAFIVGAAVGLATERTLMRPLYAGYTSWGLMRDEYAVIVTFGLSLFLINLVDKVIGPYAFRGPTLVDVSRVTIGPVLISGHRLAAAGITVVVIAITAALIKWSFWGKQIRAVAQNRLGASLAGIDTARASSIVFMLSGGLAAFAGALLSPVINASPDVGAFPAIKSYIIVVLGGMGSQLGVILAAILLTVLPEVARSFAEYRMLIFGLVMVLMMMWRPQGLLPATRPHVELPQ